MYIAAAPEGADSGHLPRLRGRYNYYITLYYTILYYTILYYTILYYTVYYTILYFNSTYQASTYCSHNMASGTYSEAPKRRGSKSSHKASRETQRSGSKGPVEAQLFPICDTCTV